MNLKAMNTLSYGLFVLTARLYGKDNGCIINTAAQVTTDPNRIAITVNKANYTHEMIRTTGFFNISVLSEEADFDLFKHFGFQSGRNTDKFANFTDFDRAKNTLAYVTKGTNAYLSAEVVSSQDLGTHTMFIAEVREAEILSDVPSATYAYYHAHIKPKPEAAGKTKTGETVWRCKVCGYEYVGEELPADFTCPLCKHPASDFEKIEKGGKTVWRCRICGYEYEGDELPADFTCPLCKHPASDFEKVVR